MQYTTYNNININFTYKELYSLVNKFWENEVISKKEYTRIWLTIIVITKNNKTYEVLKGVPFNTNNSRGILIVLKQHLNQKFSLNSKDILDNITFRYSLDKYDYSKINVSPRSNKFDTYFSELFKYNKVEKNLTKNVYTNNLMKKMKGASDILNKKNYPNHTFFRRRKI